MSSLADKIRESRRIEIPVGEIKFTAYRITDEQFRIFARDGLSGAEVCRRQVIGWDGVKESDIIDGGSDNPVKFEKQLFDLIIGDKPDWWEELEKKIIDSADQRFRERFENRKK